MACSSYFTWPARTSSRRGVWRREARLPGPPTEEGQPSGLLVGAGRRLHGRAEGARAAHGVAVSVGRGHQTGELLGVDADVESGGVGQAPSMHDLIEADEPVDRVLQGRAPGDTLEGGLRASW